jgi:hypothetical protein
MQVNDDGNLHLEESMRTIALAVIIALLIVSSEHFYFQSSGNVLVDVLVLAGVFGVLAVLPAWLLTGRAR